jgi:NitT/TauT family transport system substrate-binding protein
MRFRRLALAVIAAGLTACAPAAPGAPVASPAAAPAAPERPSSAGPAPAEAAGAAPPAPATVPAPAAVKVGLAYTASDAGLLIALDRGHYQEQNLQVDFEKIESAANLLPPLGAAQVDVGGNALTPGYLNAWARGVRIRVVADKGHNGPGFSYQGLVVRKDLWDSGVRGPAELKGRRLALPSFGSGAEPAIDRYMRQGGLRASDLDLTQLAFGDMPGALAGGQIDVAHSTEPFITRMAADGSGVILAREDDYSPNHQSAVLYYAEPFAAERGDVARRFMVAYLGAVREYNDAFRKNDPTLRPEIVSILSKYTTVKDRALYDRMQLAGLDPDGEVNVESLRADAEYWLENNYQEERTPVDELIDRSFAQYARQQLGPYR